MIANQETTDAEHPQEPLRSGGRLVVVAVVALLTAALTVLAVTQSSGPPEPAAAAPAPPDCVEAWNADGEARAYGRHNRTFHRYEGARVARIAADTVSETANGPCVVVFPSGSLDPEPEYAGQVLREDGWRPLIETLDLGRVDQLQSEALSRPNVDLVESGRLLPSAGDPAA